jgi:hypothetical protein
MPEAADASRASEAGREAGVLPEPRFVESQSHATRFPFWPHDLAHPDFAFLWSGSEPRGPALSGKIMVGKITGQT